MASIWKLNGADIYVDNWQKISEPVVAELQPIDGDESVFHYIMTPSKTINIEGTVIGETHLDDIFDGEGTNVTLITDLVPGGMTVLLMNVTANRQNTWRQTVDASQSETASVYRVSCTLRS